MIPRHRAAAPAANNPSVGTTQQEMAQRGCTKAFGHAPLDPLPSRMDLLHSQEEEPVRCCTARTDTHGQTRKRQILPLSTPKGSTQSCSSCQPLSDSAKAPQLPTFTAQEGRHQPLHPKGSFYFPLTLLSQLLALLRVLKINPGKMKWEDGIYPYNIFFFCNLNYFLSSSCEVKKVKKKKLN